MKPYADTNFLVPLYLEDPNSAVAAEIRALGKEQEMEAFPMNGLLKSEVINAFQLYVFIARTQGRGRITPESAGVASMIFEEDAERQILFQNEEIPWEKLHREFRALSHRHTARHGFRAYDLIHVASALLLGCDRFWSFDIKARQLARLEGLLVNELPDQAF